MAVESAEIRSAVSAPQLQITDGTLELLKWLGLLLMTADHVNKYLLDHSVPIAFAAARVVMPLFGFVLAYNLARPRTLERGVYPRTLRRLAFFGTLASPFFLALNGWWPLNVLWMLFLVTAICYCAELNTRWTRILAWVLFVVGGAFVEFWWFGMVFCLAAWHYCRRPSWSALVLACAGLAFLTIVNGNWWACAVVPLIVAAHFVHARVPRVRMAFYVFYPAHLAVLLVLAHQ